MKKRLLFLTTIMLSVLALMLCMSNYVWAAPGESGYIRLVYVNDEQNPNDIYIYDASGNNTVDTTIEGIEYNLETNTLTLDGFKGEDIYIEDMGQDFKMQIVNDNEITGITCMGEYVQVDETTGMQEWGNLEINGTGKLLIKGLGSIMTKDLTINDATINIITEGLQEDMFIGAILAQENLKINSANISIDGTHVGLNSRNLEINGGNVSVKTLQDGINARNIVIKDANVKVEAGKMGIIGGKIEFKSGKTVVDAGMCAVLAEQDIEGTHIILSDNMEVEEETSIRNVEVIQKRFYITTFGTDEISVNVESGEIANASKKVTIKEKEIINSGSGTGEKIEDSTNNDNQTEDKIEEATNNDNIDKGEKDTTPDTGIEETKNEILLYSLVLLILVCAIVITKSKK